MSLFPDSLKLLNVLAYLRILSTRLKKEVNQLIDKGRNIFCVDFDVAKLEAIGNSLQERLHPVKYIVNPHRLYNSRTAHIDNSMFLLPFYTTYLARLERC